MGGTTTSDEREVHSAEDLEQLSTEGPLRLDLSSALIGRDDDELASLFDRIAATPAADQIRTLVARNNDLEGPAFGRALAFG